MQNLYDTVIQLTSPELELSNSNNERNEMLDNFAYSFGWKPSDRLEIPSTGDFANVHLVVEHGLENQAVITFLKRRFTDLNYEEKRRLLNISYNNLVDWHIQIEPEQILYVFNRNDPEKIVQSHAISRDNIDSLRSNAFEQISGRRQSSNLPALDKALIDTISFWKRNLSAEMSNSVTNRELSTLFNAIIFVRAIEDNHRRLHFSNNRGAIFSQALLKNSTTFDSQQLSLQAIIFKTLEEFGHKNIPDYLIDRSALEYFDSLNQQTVIALFKDFYRIKHAQPYEYDFSLISKHALSHIYEKYTNLLRVVEPEESNFKQLTIFPEYPFSNLPKEEQNKTYGSFYTPQYIARFFARYLREQLSPFTFKQLHTLEPSLGSGIFLRTLLEIQCDLTQETQEKITPDFIEQVFKNIIGLDADPNACQAALLSLSLLHLVLTDTLPSTLSIHTQEAIQYYQNHPELKENVDAIIVNPPFVSLANQSEVMRERISDFMGQDSIGRIDLYLAFLKIGIEVLKPEGYGLFVLPHSFLLGKHAAGMRGLISQKTWVRCLVDLSAIRVFENTETYIILLIFQKRSITGIEPKATIAQCQESVSRALSDIVEGRQIESKLYNIFDVSQENFTAKEWVFIKPSVSAIQRKLDLLPTLGDFMHIRVGLQTGNNTNLKNEMTDGVN